MDRVIVTQMPTAAGIRNKLEQEFFPGDDKPEALLERISQLVGEVAKAYYNLAKHNDEWSNNACLGYAIKGAKRMGLQENDIERLVRSIYGTFDDVSVDEAKQIYNKSPY